MLIKDSVKQVIDEQGTHFAERFYRTLFERFPHIEQSFHGVDMIRQSAMLTMSLQVASQHYRRPRRISADYLKALGHRHQERGVTEDDYCAFREALFDTLAEFHGERWTSKLAEQWEAAFTLAVGIMLEGTRDA